MKAIVNKISAIGFCDFGVCDYKGTKYLLVFMDYGYYKETSSENFQVSPYYFASNRCYFGAKELCAFIECEGYMARLENKFPYDHVLEKCGAKRGDNNLFFIEKCGSLFCVHMIATNAPLNDKQLGSRDCTHCGKCIKSCPMGALGDSLNKDLCLRHRMDIIGDKVCCDKITRLLGCDECQRVCHLNNREENNINYDVFNRKKIIEGDMNGISDLVGKNMARKSRLQFQGMSITVNEKKTEYADLIINTSVIDRLSELQKWCYNSLKNC